MNQQLENRLRALEAALDELFLRIEKLEAAAAEELREQEEDWQ